ncbi:MAG TPA: DUF420 domain-containing protein [Pirellulaceae bacterium]|nr:DUF420 domain-containing protein [Pirellulaceae bacterium]HMO90627.1 DUF420 domain-containing protein [Pirellulaceae bacterium]HMP67794.1 DUF420 domain-containing protein [Pirellulaceae bacterium]
MINGLLPTRATLMLDLLVVGMVIIVAAMFLSVLLVKAGRYKMHRQIQTVLSAILLIVVIMFEVDVRFFTDWRALARESAYFESGWVFRTLIIHLVFAIPTPFVWGTVLVLAWKNFANPPQPGAHSRLHCKLGYTAIGLMLMTAITGWLFYVTAFVL